MHRMQALHIQSASGHTLADCKHRMRCIYLSDRVEHHHRCQSGFAPPRQFGSSARVPHVSRQYARTTGIRCSNVVATCLTSVHVDRSVHVLQRSTILRSTQPSRQDSSNASSSAEATNNEAGPVRAADAISSRASLDDAAGDMPDEVGLVPNGNGSIETAAGEAFQSSQPAQPPDEAAPLLSGLQKALAAALLVSPFFFWGTSMVGMKVSVSIIFNTAPETCSRSPAAPYSAAARFAARLEGAAAPRARTERAVWPQVLAPHTSPLFVSAWRLGPAGALLLAWGASRGRPQPGGAMAWVSIAAFSLVDATCFQVEQCAQAPAMLRLLQACVHAVCHWIPQNTMTSLQLPTSCDAC